MPTNPAGAATPASSAAKLSPRGIASVLSRFQAPEPFYIQPFNPGDQPIIPRNLNLTRPLESIEIVILARVVIGTANYSAVAAEAPVTLLQRVRLQGTHRVFNQIIPVDVSGATIFAWPRLFQGKGNSLFINNTLQPELTDPYAQVGSVFGNTGTYDLEIHYTIPFAPVFGPAGRRAMNYFTLQPSDWADTLQLQLFFGDKTSFGTPAGGTTVTFSAFGSGSGQPTCYILTNYQILGPMANSIQSGVRIWNESNLIAGSLGSVANGVRLALLQKQKTTNIVVKTGIQQAALSPSVVVFSSLSNTILEMTQIVVDNKPIRNNQLNTAIREYNSRMFSAGRIQGYLPFTFIESQTPLTAFLANTALGGATFELDSNVIASASNQFGTYVQEQILGVPRGK